nr:MAG TPA: nucleoid-associated protein [Caudoviricetes sp.]
MTEYVFTLTDKTPSVEIDVKETAIAQGAGQDLYDRAKKELGYTGTFGEFLASFKGERGADGLPGAKGDTGATGATGTNGLPGVKGERGADGAVGATGAKGDTGERGQDGKSAYEIAVANGYVGSEEAWLYSLKGRDGSPGRDGRNGLSAYELADGELLFGTVGKWLESLKGAKGDKGDPGVGIPQKLTLSGNTLTLSDGGGSVTLPSQPATNAPQANEYEIHGTGMPNGKVTAPVGTTYVDTAATNGALKWIKRTGNNNQGWEVLTGDTGWRTLTIASKLGNSYLKVRRKNDTVMYQFGGLQWGWFGIVRRGGPGYVIQPSDRERNVFILGLNQVPQGFRSEFSLIGGIHNDKGVPYGTWYLGGPGDGNMIRFQFTDPVPTDRDIGDIRVSSIMYLTNDPWPTALP